MRPPNVELHIEELVLRGFPHSQRYEIAEAVGRELESLLSQRVPQSLGAGASIDRLDAGAFETKQAARPEAIGSGIAQKIYGGMGS
jgi:hypothetical protein